MRCNHCGAPDCRMIEPPSRSWRLYQCRLCQRVYPPAETPEERAARLAARREQMRQSARDALAPVRALIIEAIRCSRKTTSYGIARWLQTDRVLRHGVYPRDWKYVPPTDARGVRRWLGRMSAEGMVAENDDGTWSVTPPTLRSQE